MTGTKPYGLRGIEGVGKYSKDYSTLLTGGTTDNLAVTFLGLYGLNWQITAVNGDLATVQFTVENSSTSDYVDLEQLKKLFNPPSDDPLMYNVYEIQLDHVQTINRLLKDKIEFDFNANAYYVECAQLPLYDFGKKT